MANIKSQKKRNTQNERRRDRNKAVRSELKTRVKLASTALETQAEDAPVRTQRSRRFAGRPSEPAGRGSRSRVFLPVPATFATFLA